MLLYSPFQISQLIESIDPFIIQNSSLIMFPEVSSNLKRKAESLEASDQIDKKRKKNPQYIERKNQKKNEKRKKTRYQNKKFKESSSLKRKGKNLETKEQIEKKRDKSPQYIERKNQKKNEKRKIKRYQNKNMKKELETNTKRYQKKKNQNKNQKKNQRKRMRGVEYQKRHRNHMFEVRNYENYRSRMVEEYHEFSRKYQNLIYDYELSIWEGPIHTCGSCGGIFFAKSIRVHRIDEIKPEIVNELSKLDNNHIQLCDTCGRSVKRGAIPKLCLTNGLEFPPIPPELKDLSELEERLISPRIPFMQIRELGVDKQYGIKGNVVNVPIDIDNTVKLLPRNFDKTETIQILLKRMIQHKSTYIKEYIRPHKVKTAAKYIVQQPLYVEEGIKLSDEWFDTRMDEVKEFIIDTDDDKQTDDTIQQVNDEWDETAYDLPINPSNNETLLFAPGEGIRPVSLLYDKYAEELSFPTIFCGQKRDFKIKFSISDLTKSYLRRSDRRAISTPYIFYLQRKKQMLSLRDSIMICMRKRSIQNQLTVEQVLNFENINNLLNSDEAYKVLVQDRSSPVYWQQKMKELFAMIRQLGVPTFFLTLSAAETRWPELLIILAKVNRNVDMTEEEVSLLSFPEKCDLIRNDPVTCTRYFDHRIRELFKVLKANNGPFSPFKLVDLYLRIEFQSRGSAHVHSLLWLENAPKYDPKVLESKKICEEFIDRFISCSTVDESLEEYTKLQYHKHSKSCKRLKEDNIICRFGIPVYPMPRTMILEPLELDNLSEEEIDDLEENMNLIDRRIAEIDQFVSKNKFFPIDMNFDEILRQLNLSEAEYIRSIRYSINRPKVFLRRRPSEIRYNAFNKEILPIHRANMDIQFVLDPYCCVHYILNYINKSNRGMSNLLRSMIDDCKTGYVSHQQKLQKICSVFMNCSEMSAQEAVYILLSIPLSISSRPVIFINTGEKDQRSRILKSEKQLKELPADSNDVMVNGLLDFYSARPVEMEEICLADFAAEFNYTKTKKVNVFDDEEKDEELNENLDISMIKKFKLNNDFGWVYRRTKPKIIRYRKYQLEKDRKNYFREKCMLYLPWRDEDSELSDIDCEYKYHINKELIDLIEKKYIENFEIKYEEIELDINMKISSEEPGAEDNPIEDEYSVYDLQRIESNLAEEFGQNKSENNQKFTFTGPGIMKEDEYFQLIRKLNQKQRNYLLEILHLVRINSEPFHHFITGGAGTGKSVLISAIYQAMNRHFIQLYQQPDKVKVLLLGPTGMASFHIRGSTIHSALGIPVSQNSSLPILSADSKSTLRNRFWYLKIIIIDEISMVGAQTLRKIDNQFNQIFENTKSFGGLSVLVFGDFNQLRPVEDAFIFENPSRNNYSSLSGPLLWRIFKIHKLTEIMREKNSFDVHHCSQQSIFR